jgi:hypothetical protein
MPSPGFQSRLENSHHHNFRRIDRASLLSGCVSVDPLRRASFLPHVGTGSKVNTQLVGTDRCQLSGVCHLRASSRDLRILIITTSDESIEREHPLRRASFLPHVGTGSKVNTQLVGTTRDRPVALSLQQTTSERGGGGRRPAGCGARRFPLALFRRGALARHRAFSRRHSCCQITSRPKGRSSRERRVVKTSRASAYLLSCI